MCGSSMEAANPPVQVKVAGETRFKAFRSVLHRPGHHPLGRIVTGPPLISHSRHPTARHWYAHVLTLSGTIQTGDSQSHSPSPPRKPGVQSRELGDWPPWVPPLSRA